jgi:hypothetical protein
MPGWREAVLVNAFEPVMTLRLSVFGASSSSDAHPDEGN